MKDEHYIEEKGELDWLSEQRARELAWEMEELRELEEQERIQALKEKAAHGQKFKPGSKKFRQDKLSKVIEKTYKGLLLKGAEPTAREVLYALPVGPGEVVEKIDGDDGIEWTGTGGKPKHTSFKTFQKRLTHIREKNLT